MRRHDVIDALHDYLKADGTPDEVQAALTNFLVEYSEERSRLVYKSAKRSGISEVFDAEGLPAYFFYPKDKAGKPIVPGRRYRCPDGELHTLRGIYVDGSREGTYQVYEDGYIYDNTGVLVTRRNFLKDVTGE